MQRIVTVIPARGGSKRIPKKNIVDIVGRPLISYAIKTSDKCSLVDETWVSTNDVEIATTAEHYGANVHWRPKEISGDTATSESALIEFEKNSATNFDILVFMQATSPLTKPEHLAQGIELVKSGRYDSVLSVCEDTHFYWDENGQPINYDLNKRPRSQDIEKWYRETGSFYISRKESLLKSKCRVSGRIGYVVLPLHQSFEIDTYEDLDIVSALLTAKSSNGSAVDTV